MLTGKWADRKKHYPLPGSLTFYRTGFIGRSSSSDGLRKNIAKHTVDLIAIKESAGVMVSRSMEMSILFGVSKTIAVAPGMNSDHVKLHKAAERKVRSGDRKIAYVFTWSDQSVEQEIRELWSGWEVVPLPAEMLAALRKNAPQPQLFELSSEGFNS